MDSTPVSHRSNPTSQAKSASRLARITYSANQEPLRFSLDLIPASPKKTPSTPAFCTNTLPLQELLLLSSSPSAKSRTRLLDRLDMAEEAVPEPTGSRRRCKSRAQLGSLGCGSPRNSSRRLRRRSEMEIREEKDLKGLAEEIDKARKKRHTGRSKKDKLSLAPSLPSSSSSSKVEDGGEGNLDKIGMIFYDLIMWKDVAKSSLWFGLGCLCFLSSGFAKGINFSMLSMTCRLGLFFLGASFCSSAICQRNSSEEKLKFKLKDEDILRVSRLILPAANLAISKTRELFSGEPSMTLKVTPFLLLGAEYGHLVTLWRFFAIGFFTSFTIPKLYACYSTQINQKVDSMKHWALEAWGACSHKKIVAASAITAFWNLSSVKTRIFTAFLSLVILRRCRQDPKQEEEEQGEKEPQQALILAEGG